MKRIPLTQEQYALVDDEDYMWCRAWKWQVMQHSKHRTLYAVRGAWDPATQKQATVLMHRSLVGIIDPKIEVDHKDGNGLNNQRANLRISSHAQNGRNRKLNQNNKSGYKGVHWNKKANKWHAQIRVNGKAIHLGVFTDPVEAASEYDKAARLYHGEFAHTNQKASNR